MLPFKIQLKEQIWFDLLKATNKQSQPAGLNLQGG